MLVVETIAKICRAFFVQGKPIKVICRELRLSRKVVRKVIRSKATEFHYEREAQPLPKIGPWSEKLDQLLSVNEAKVARERLTLIRLFEELRGLGYDGGYDAVRRYARRWAKERGQSTAAAYVPLSFAPGEAYQFDWSHEVVLLSGVTGDYPTTKPKGGFGRPFCFDVYYVPADGLLLERIMAKGTVKWFNSQKGYGFIQPQGGGKDVFVHISAVERAGLSGLNEGQVVEYEEVSNKGKTSADHLKVQR